MYWTCSSGGEDEECARNCGGETSLETGACKTGKEVR